jgi:hypothetical protein
VKERYSKVLKEQEPSSRPTGTVGRHTARDATERGAKTMIVVTVEKRNRMTTVMSTVRASSIEQALQLVGGDAHVVFPIDGERFFASKGSSESVEELPSVPNEAVVAP